MSRGQIDALCVIGAVLTACGAHQTAPPPPGPEICDNRRDDNGDGKVDCADPQCFGSLRCPGLETCDNGVDDDGNGLVDCADPGCAGFPACIDAGSSAGGGAAGGLGGGAAGGLGGGSAGGSGGGSAGGAGGGTAGGAGGGSAGGSGGGTAGGSGGGATGGSGGGAADAGPCGAGPAVDHLLLSEVRVEPTAAESVEIYNPTALTIDLSNYRLYNATYLSTDGGSDCHYYAHDAGTCGATFSDFDLQFPPGATVGPGQLKVIALGGAINYCGDAGLCGTRLPDFEIPPAGGGSPAVPDMRGWWDPAATLGYLTNASEDLVLYKWDGASPTVEDVDYFVWGTNLSIRTDKTGIPGYHPDTPVGAQQAMTTPSTAATDYQRLCYNENAEARSGGNGLTGHSETGENLLANWLVGVPSLGAKTPGSSP